MVRAEWPKPGGCSVAAPGRLYSGASLGYHLVSMTAGGPAPIIAAALFALYGTSMAIVAYIVICALISVASAAALRDRTTEDIDIDTEEVATTRAAAAQA